jgi:hypothetical protein
MFVCVYIFISNSDLYHPTYKLTKVQKGVSFTGIRIFNNLPYSIKILSDDVNKFKYPLKKMSPYGLFLFFR